jgi:hypothetical protein
MARETLANTVHEHGNELLGLASELEQITVREWLVEQGLAPNISVIDFAVHCLRDEGLEVDRPLADAVLWNCTGFPAFWHIPRHGAHPIECCGTQLRGWARVCLRSRGMAFAMMDDPTASFETALAILDKHDLDARARLLEDED